MSQARDAVLGRIRRSLGRAAEDGEANAAVAARLAEPPRGPQPARADIGSDAQVELFEAMAVELAATVARVPDADAVPQAIADYLKSSNLPPQIRLAPDPDLEALPWERQPLLEVATGRADAQDQVSVTGAVAGIAETGTLLLTSGARSPVTLNFLPDTHVVVLKASQIVGHYEDAWEQIRATYGPGSLPRTVNFITGPSRTGDIEQTILLGAHGPRRLHIVLVEDAAGPGSGSGGGAGNGG